MIILGFHFLRQLIVEVFFVVNCSRFYFSSALNYREIFSSFTCVSQPNKCIQQFSKHCGAVKLQLDNRSITISYLISISSHKINTLIKLGKKKKKKKKHKKWEIYHQKWMQCNSLCQFWALLRLQQWPSMQWVSMRLER